MTSSSYQYLTSTGVIVPDTEATLAEVQTEWLNALGQDLVLTPSTAQGVLITGETNARNNVLTGDAALANQINPNYAGGVFLDALLALTGVQRNQQQFTVVNNVSLTAAPGTVIPQNAQAKTEAGDLFALTGAVTLTGGSGFGTFQALEAGPIPCGAGELTAIVTGILGWESVDNSSSSDPASTTTLGTTTQSDQSARSYRQNTLAFNGISLAAAITSALYATEGVTSLTFQENTSASTQTINGISMVAHSVYACVDGGTDTAVAAALLENKSSGASWNGGTSVSVVEPASGQTYTVLFDRPSQVEILVKVTTPNGNEATIIQSVLDYAAGLISITDQNGVLSPLAGFVVGASVSPFDIAGAIMAENPGIYISNLQIAVSSGSPVYSNSPIAIGVNQIAYVQESDITVVTG